MRGGVRAGDILDRQGFMGNKVVQVQKGVTPFAAEFLTRLRYFERVPLQNVGSTNTASVYSFRLNSLYDPNFTGTGHQPYQYDQLTPMYNNYIVTQADFKVRIRVAGASAAYEGIFVGASVFADTNVSDSASGKTISEIAEKAVTQVRPVSVSLMKQNWTTFQGSIDIARCLGVSKVSYMGDLSAHGAVYNTNPSRTVYLELCIVDPDSNSGSDMDADVEITYHAKMYGYKGPAQS